MGVKIIGLSALKSALAEVRRRLGEEAVIQEKVAELMERNVHRATGYLASTIYPGGADAPYAGYEEERGGSHAYATKSIEDFDYDKHLSYLVEPF